MLGWRAAILVVLIVASGASASDNLLRHDLAGPGWFEINLSGSGRLDINVTTMGGPEGAVVVVLIYDENDTFRDMITSEFADSDAWIHASVPGIAHETLRIGQENYGILSSTRFMGSFAGWTVVGWAATPGPMSVSANALSGSWLVELLHAGDGAFYSNGDDLAGAQVVASYFGFRAEAQYEARWPFHTEGALLGSFGSPGIVPAGAVLSRIDGPMGSIDCPCVFTDRNGIGALPPGDYEYVRTSAGADLGGAPIVAMDYSPNT